MSPTKGIETPPFEDNLGAVVAVESFIGIVLPPLFLLPGLARITLAAGVSPMGNSMRWCNQCCFFFLPEVFLLSVSSPTVARDATKSSGMPSVLAMVSCKSLCYEIAKESTALWCLMRGGKRFSWIEVSRDVVVVGFGGGSSFTS
jgi:hypothetical protein